MSEDVVPSQSECGLTPTQERVAGLSVPDPVGGVHDGFGITSAAVLVDIGGEVQSEPKVVDGTNAVAEIVGVEVRCCRGCCAVALVAEVAVKVYFEVVFCIAGTIIVL